MTINQIADDAIGLFLECLDHMDVEVGLDPDDIERAKAKALIEVSEGTVEEQRRLDAFPELLAALERLLSESPYESNAADCECGEDGNGNAGACEHIQAHRAIAKAKGQNL